MLAEAANANLVRVLAYALAAAVCIVAWRRERSRNSPPRSELWPNLWLLTGVLLLGFALARLLGAADVVTDIGREEARRSGYYEARRGLQALLMGGISFAWMASVLVAVWRVPERRRRYLPAVTVVLFLVFFAAVRLVSLHHVDQLLYNRPIAGVRPVVFVEVGALLALSALTLFTLGRSTGGRIRRNSIVSGPQPEASRSAPP